MDSIVCTVDMLVCNGTLALSPNGSDIVVENAKIKSSVGLEQTENYKAHTADDEAKTSCHDTRNRTLGFLSSGKPFCGQTPVILVFSKLLLLLVYLCTASYHTNGTGEHCSGQTQGI
jgi:hypothetical protein